ncbi:CsbD family protein [Roseovarius sp. D0-M9]|uniref:CsbD family protein n=1 Tax=Roseovarius sp. D0-M9 TaxID=3127117 RepID=UPI00300FCAD1
MNWDTIKGNWKQLTGEAKTHWGKLTDDDVQQAAGERDKLVGKIQERYGIGKEEAERQVDDFAAKH